MTDVGLVPAKKRTVSMRLRWPLVKICAVMRAWYIKKFQVNIASRLFDRDI
jgi:hypothetical protein